MKLENKAVQDSVLIPSFKIKVTTAGADTVVTETFSEANFRFANRGPYKVTVQGTVAADSARVSSDFTTLVINLSGSSAGTDTLTIPALWVVATNTTLGTTNDGDTGDVLVLHLGSSVAYDLISVADGILFKVFPGPLYNVSIIHQAAPNPVIAGANFTVTLSLTDMFGNVTNDTVTTIPLAAVLDPTHSSPNGTLT